MITFEGITVWVALAFVLWPVITFALHFVIRRKGGAGVTAAVLSWLIARAALSMMAPLFHWLGRHL